MRRMRRTITATIITTAAATIMTTITTMRMGTTMAITTITD